MAIRYSGDVEVRVSYRNGIYHGTVRAPGFAAKGTLKPHQAGLTRKQTPDSSEAYDAVALAFLQEARSLARRGPGLPLSYEGSKIVLRRTFQAPCPVRINKRGA